MFGLFFVGISPKTSFLLPAGSHIMVNASQFWHKGKQVWIRHGRTRRGGLVFLDSGGYIFFNRQDDYPFSPGQYMNLVSYLRPDFFASMDYPCEPSITERLPDLPIAERIQVTVSNAVTLAAMEEMTPGSRLVPVIQGWTLDDYKYCLNLYADNDCLRPFMAVGSMCVRQNDAGILDLIRGIYEHATTLGVERLHYFGLKLTPRLSQVQDLIYSRDSAAVYFSPNRAIKKKWGGRRFASTTPQKREAIQYFLSKVERYGLTWRTI